MRNKQSQKSVKPAAAPGYASAIAGKLGQMAATAEQRHGVYGDNYKRHGVVMAALFPDGVQIKTAEEFNRWHLLDQIVNKLTRFAVTGLTHLDSIHDAGVYCAMEETLVSAATKPLPKGAPR